MTTADRPSSVTEDAARAAILRARGAEGDVLLPSEEAILAAFRAAGLLATARTRPTREELVIAIRDADLRYTDSGMAVTAGDYADAVLVLLRGGER